MKTTNQQTEKHMIPRLKVMGYILFVFAIAALFYDFLPSFASEVELLEEEAVAELEEPAPLNPYMVSASFVVVGASCFLISWKKRKSLFSASSQKQHDE